MGCFNLQQLYQRMMERLSMSEEDKDAVKLDVKCIYCTRRERLIHFGQLAKGNHIQLKGDKFRLNVGKKQIAIYTHHAIVKEVKLINQFEAELTLIEFISAPYDSDLKIRETRSIKTLTNEDIYIIRYGHRTHDPDVIVRRAESFVLECQSTDPDLKYSLLTCNCEHFCHWCCTGNESSYQVHNFKGAIKNILTGGANIAGKILRVVLRLVFVSVDDLTKAAAGAVLYVPWGVLSALALIYLVYCIYSHIQLNTEKKSGNICSSCCSRLQLDLWLRFAIYAVTQVGGLALIGVLMTVIASKGIAVGALVLISILTLGSMWLIPKLKNMLCSPFKGRKVKVETMNNVGRADVISFRYKGLMHDAIVTRAFPDKQDEKKGIITVIHYSKLSVFGRRKIIEEELHVDLRRRTILSHVYDPNSIKVHQPDMVVERARKRIGETKFGCLSNRSCHFCYWAKVDVDDIDEDVPLLVPESVQYLYNRELDPLESFSRLQSLHVDHRPNRTHATQTLETTWAKIRDDIKNGQLIQFKVHGCWHKAIVTRVVFDVDISSKLSVTVVHYGRKREVTEDTMEFDLNKVDIWIYKYHPLSRYSRDDVVRRARARIGENKYHPITHNSTHLTEEIVEKGRDTLLSDINEIHAGDAIIFYYWSFKHAAIVTRVTQGESKDNRSGRVRIIHYACPGLFSQRRILEETLPMDLNVDHIYKMSFDGCIRYPTSRIIKRAQSRLYETRFSLFRNTSWDFVQWATVVQTPVIVQEVKHRQLEASPHQHPQEVQNRLLLPKVKDASGKFQIMDVQTWDDLSPGDIVEFNYYWISHQGILSEIDPIRMEIKVIHYGASHLFAVRTIMLDIFKFNLKRDKLVVYRTDPRNCYSRQEIVDRAKRRVGEQDWRTGNRSWDMCLACVFKKENNEAPMVPRTEEKKVMRG